MSIKYFSLIKITLFVICYTLSVTTIYAQEKLITPDISKINNNEVWAIKNRDVTVDSSIYLNSKLKDGLLYFKNQQFKNCIVDVDIKGTNQKGRSFVGIAFQIENDSLYDVVYFRPFNFRDTVKSKYSVQYVSKPQFEWYTLRTNSPNTYENRINQIVDPDDWFHVTIEINYPEVRVFVNNSKKPSLAVKALSQQGDGYIGFWVGNNSDGYFRNLNITLIQ